MEKYFSIGEISKIHNIPIQTLRYYDKIGLLTPAYIDKYTNYRYYSFEQFIYLDTIKYLRFLGVPLKDIKEQLQSGEVTSSIKLLEVQSKEIDSKIENLLDIKNKITNKINRMKLGVDADLIGKITIKTFEERTIAKVQIKDIDDKIQFENSLRELGSFLENETGVFDGDIGFICSYETFKNNGYLNYKYLTLPISNTIYNKNSTFLSKVPSGTFLCMMYKGPYNTSFHAHEKLMKYINDNNIQVLGDIYEFSIIEPLLVTKADSFVTEIQIPIKPL